MLELNVAPTPRYLSPASPLQSRYHLPAVHDVYIYTLMPGSNSAVGTVGVDYLPELVSWGYPGTTLASSAWKL